MPKASSHDFLKKSPLSLRGGFGAFLCLLLLVSCSTRKNTSGSRFYHQWTTRYNIYFHGNSALCSTYDQQIADYREGYVERLFPDIARQKKEADAREGGPFDRAVEKGRGAIRQHSIRVKPEIKSSPQSLRGKKKTFYEQKEFNPFLYRAWFLVGQGQYYNGDLLQAMSTFGYMARLYSSSESIRTEARLWQARCYVALGWNEDAQRIWEGLSASAFDYRSHPAYTMAHLEKALSENHLSEAVEYLHQALSAEKNTIQKARLYYLLGQLQSEMGLWKEARRSFARMGRMSVPYPLSFASRLRQIEIDAMDRPKPAIRSIDREIRKSRNKDFLDVLYLSQGRIYLSHQDSTAAKVSLHKALTESTQKGADYAVAGALLGDVCFAQRDWIGAQEAYAWAVGAMNKKHPDYERVAGISRNMDALAEHLKQIREQDSLLYVATLPEEKRLQHIDSIINAYKEEQKRLERETKREQQRQEQEAFNEEIGTTSGRPDKGNNTAPVPSGGNGRFYFYNPPLVDQGRRSFEKRWGKRPLEDDWRRRSKQIEVRPEENARQDGEGKPSDTSTETTAEPETLASADDPTQREYYLQRLPLTREAKEESHGVIAHAMEGVGKVLNERFDLVAESAEAYEKLLARYPSYEERLNVFYTLYMLYSRMQNPARAELWRKKLLALYPEDPLAEVLRDPHYIENLKREIGREDALYAQTLESYLRGNSREVESLYREFTSRYPMSELLPQISFVRAMNFVLEGNATRFAEELRRIGTDYPKAEIIPLVAQISERLSAGGQIYRTGYRGIDRSTSSTSSSSSETSPKHPFEVGSAAEPYRVLLIFPKDSYKKNELLFSVGGFNFTRVTRYTLDVLYETQNPMDVVSTTGFPDARSAWSYLALASSSEGYLKYMNRQTLLVAISEKNYQKWIEGGGLWGYISFVESELLDRVPEAALAVERYHDLFSPESEKEGADGASRRLMPQKPVDFTIQREQYDTKTKSSSQETEPTESKADAPSKSNYTIETGRHLTLEDMRKIELERKVQEKKAKEEAEKLRKQKEKEKQAQARVQNAKKNKR